MSRSASQTLSRDLHALADEATDHLKDAARKTGSEATDAVVRSIKAISRAADHLRDEAETIAGFARERASSLVREHPVVAGFSTSMIASLGVAVLATFALLRLSQS